jgi:CubicO group peptidase (beta-lactamase class C family)
MSAAISGVSHQHELERTFAVIPGYRCAHPGYGSYVVETSGVVLYDASMNRHIAFIRTFPFIASIALSCAIPPAASAQPIAANPAIEARIQALIPDLETYTRSAMQAFGVPGLAIGIVAGDRLVYAKGFGVRGKTGGAPVDSHTVFQVGSTTKAFLAATQGIMVDRGKFRWDDRVVDLYPDFQLKDPWVTREFRVFDLLAQRSGLPPYANDALGFIGLDETAMVRSLRYVEPVSSFRTTFAYTNITHVLAGFIVAKAAGAPDWNTVLRQELLDPLGMKDSSYTAAAIAAAPNHAEGYRWTPNGMVELPFTQVFPYDYGGAGDINSNVEDMARWVRLQLGDGSFEGRRIVSAASMAAARTPKVAVSDKAFYALGWIVQQTPNGNIVWHNGGTSGFGAYVGLLLDNGVGLVILANAVGFPDAIAAWTMDRLLGNPQVDQAANLLKTATAKYEAAVKMFAKPEHPRPFPLLAPLAGRFANPAIGKISVTMEGDSLILEITATGAKLKLEPWDGDVFTAKMMPLGRFATIAEDLGPLPAGFVQFQIDKEGKLNVLRFSFDDGQAYEFVRE